MTAISYSCEAIMPHFVWLGDVVVFIEINGDSLLLAIGFVVAVRAFAKRCHQWLKKLLK